MEGKDEWGSQEDSVERTHVFQTSKSIESFENDDFY